MRLLRRSDRQGPRQGCPLGLLAGSPNSDLPARLPPPLPRPEDRSWGILRISNAMPVPGAVQAGQRPALSLSGGPLVTKADTRSLNVPSGGLRAVWGRDRGPLASTGGPFCFPHRQAAGSRHPHLALTASRSCTSATSGNSPRAGWRITTRTPSTVMGRPASAAAHGSAIDRSPRARQGMQQEREDNPQEDDQPHDQA